jgi:hypothetical protein
MPPKGEQIFRLTFRPGFGVEVYGKNALCRFNYNGHFGKFNTNLKFKRRSKIKHSYATTIVGICGTPLYVTLAALGWSFSWNTFDESHTFDKSVTSLYHFSL